MKKASEIPAFNFKTGKSNVSINFLLSRNFVEYSEKNYIAMRALFITCPRTLTSVIAHNGGECIEKIMKAYLQIKNPEVENAAIYGHKIEEVRKDCAKVDKYFENPELKAFCRQYSDHGNEVLRFGLTKKVNSYQININEIVRVVDKFYSEILLKLPLTFFAHNIIAVLFCNSPFSKNVISSYAHYNSQELINLKSWIKLNNNHLEKFIVEAKRLFNQIKT